jgi:hypothetical protein
MIRALNLLTAFGECLNWTVIFSHVISYGLSAKLVLSRGFGWLQVFEGRDASSLEGLSLRWRLLQRLVLGCFTHDDVHAVILQIGPSFSQILF